jgi:hypothetical protein
MLGGPWPLPAPLAPPVVVALPHQLGEPTPANDGRLARFTGVYSFLVAFF